MAFDPFAGLVDSLSKGARASYGFLRSLALEVPKLSKASILSTLRNANFSIRTDTGNTLIDIIRENRNPTAFIKLFGENAILPPSVHSVSATTLHGGNNFYYEVGTNSSNPLVPPSVYVSSSTPLSADEIYGKAAGYFTYEKTAEVDMSPGALKDVTFTVDNARVSPGYGGEYQDNTAYGGA